MMPRRHQCDDLGRHERRLGRETCPQVWMLQAKSAAIIQYVLHYVQSYEIVNCTWAQTQDLFAFLVIHQQASYFRRRTKKPPLIIPVTHGFSLKAEG